MFRLQTLHSIAPAVMAIGVALAAGTAGVHLAGAKNGFSVAQTQGMNNRQDRRQDRQGDRTDRRDDRQDCRQEEGVVGSDKRDCKQEERQERNSDESLSNTPTSDDG